MAAGRSIGVGGTRRLLVSLVRAPVAVGLAVAVLGFAAIRLTPDGPRTAAWWPAAGVAVAGVACTTGRRRAAVLLAVAAGSVLGNLAAGRAPALALGFALANTAEAAVVGVLLGRRRTGRAGPRLTGMADLGLLVGAATAGALVVGVLGAAALLAVPGAGWGSWWRIAAAHATAVLLVVPLVMRLPDPPAGVGTAERVAVWAVLLASTGAVFGSGIFLPLTFVPAAVLVWAGLRLGVATAAAQLVVVGVAVALLSAAGRGPFATIALLPAPLAPIVTESLVQMFLGCCVVVVLALAVLAAQREAALAALAHQRRFDQAVLETVDAGVLACDAEGTIVLRNNAHRRVTGVADDGRTVDPDALAARLDVRCDGEPVPPDRTPLRRALAGEVLHRVEMRMGPRDGPAHDLVATATPILDADGRVAGAVATFTDVTAERITQAHLRDSIAFHDAVLTASPDMIYVADVDGHRLTFCSRPLSEVIGGAPANGPEDPDAMGGDTLAALVHPDDVARLHAADAAVAALGDGEIGKVRLRVAVGEGHRCLSRRVTPFTRDAQGRVTQVLGVARDVTDNVAFEDRLAAAALHDPLTGLPNRRLLVERLDAALTARAAGTSLPRPIAVLFCDLDGFKRINDTAGHDVGDVVLRVTAARLRAALRSGDTVARVGGDEFVVVLDGSGPGDPAAHAEATAARLAEALREPVVVAGTAHTVTVSVGVAFAADGEDPAVALRDADRAMYRAKRRSRVDDLDEETGSARAGVG